MKIDVNGVRLHVEAQGHGAPTLVFLHYWGGSSRTWRHVTAPLSADHRTLAIDHRGWGGSDAPTDGYALATLADDALGVVRALGIGRHVLVGHSMGGKTAQLIASRRPAGLAGLVLVASAPPTPMAVPLAGREGMVEAYRTRAGVERTIDEVLTANPLDPADRAQVIEDTLRGAPSAKRAWPLVISQEDISEAVAAIAAPTLVIGGDEDRVDTPDALRKELIPRIPGARLEVVRGTGHLSPLEVPDALVRLIRTFVRDVVGERG